MKTNLSLKSPAGLRTVLILAALGGVGCNGIFTKPQTELVGGHAESAPADFAPQFVLSGEDGMLLTSETSDAATARQPSEILQQGDDLFFKKTIRLPESESGPQLFLAWSEGAFGGIRDASFEYWTLDSRNQSTPVTPRSEVSYDRETGHWYIPMSRLFPNRGEDVDPGAQQLIALDLQLSNGSHRQLKIRFNAHGALPQIVPVRARVAEIGAPDALLRQACTGSIEAVSEEFYNPTRRPLTLWLKPALSEDAFEAVDDVTTTVSFPTLPALTVSGNPVQSEGRLQLSAVHVSRPAGEQDLIRVGDFGGDAIPVAMRPLERLTISYYVSATSGSEPCHKPAPGVYPTEDPRITQSWTVAGAHLHGNVSREVRLSEFSDSKNLKRLTEGELPFAMGGGRKASQ